MREGTVEGTWFSQESDMHTHRHIHPQFLYSCVQSHHVRGMSQTFGIERDRFQWKKVQIGERFPLPSEMKLAGTSDHSQYLYVVSRLTECRPRVYLWLWNWICSCCCDHTQSALNQSSAGRNWPYYPLEDQPPTKQDKQTGSHWSSKMVIPNISANMKERSVTQHINSPARYEHSELSRICYGDPRYMCISGLVVSG